MTLGEELSLDKGALVVWTGAAAHDDQAAQLLGQQLRQRREEALDKRADQIFSQVPNASGSRVVGGPFLRAALRPESDAAASARSRGRADEQPLHVWLDTARAGSKRLPGAGLSDSSAVRLIGPYRLRVLRSEVIAGSASGEDGGLQRAETLSVTFALDKPKADVLRAARAARRGKQRVHLP